MKILLLGGEGYIGRVVSEFLINKSNYVISYDNLIYGQKNNTDQESFKFIKGDIADGKKIHKILEEVDYVVILVGLVGDPITKKYPYESSLINNNYLKDIIKIIFKLNLKKLIFISTCSNYGLINDNDEADENFELNPLSLYAKSKVEIEKYLLDYKDNNTETTILRFSTAFGLSPRMRFDLTVNEFVREMYVNKNISVFDEDTWRPYCHIYDFARAIWRVLNEKTQICKNQIYNVGSSNNNYSKRMIVEKILKKIPNAKVSYREKGEDRRNYRVNFNKIKKEIGFMTKFTIDNGITEILNVLKEGKYSTINKEKNLYGNYMINYNHEKFN